jgi:hypothetical protein
MQKWCVHKLRFSFLTFVLSVVEPGVPEQEAYSKRM